MSPPGRTMSSITGVGGIARLGGLEKDPLTGVGLPRGWSYARLPVDRRRLVRFVGHAGRAGRVRRWHAPQARQTARAQAILQQAPQSPNAPRVALVWQCSKRQNVLSTWRSMVRLDWRSMVVHSNPPKVQRFHRPPATNLWCLCVCVCMYDVCGGLWG